MTATDPRTAEEQRNDRWAGIAMLVLVFGGGALGLTVDALLRAAGG